MSLDQLTILLVEDNPVDTRLVRDMLTEARSASFRVESVDRLSTALDRLSQGEVDVVLLDLSLPDSLGLDTFARAHAYAPTVPIVVLSGMDDETFAVQAVQWGAQDYLAKGRLDAQVLVRSIRYALERGRAERERQQLLAREQAARAEAEAARERTAFLAEAGKQLVGSLGYQATFQQVARIVVPTLADWCIVDAIEANGSLHQVAVAHVDADKEELIRELRRRYPPLKDPPHPIWRVARTGQPEVASDVSDADLAERARDADHLRLLRELGIRSHMVIPLVARGRPVGVLSFVAGVSRRYYGTADLAMAREFGYLAALALDNAHLYRELEDQIEAHVRLNAALRETAEARDRALVELQQSLIEREAFLSSATHDIRTPLSTIKGLSQLLRRRAARDGTLQPEQVLDALASIEAASTKIGLLLNELLDLTRLQLGQPLPLDRDEVDLVALTRRVADECQQMAEHHRIRLETSVTELAGEWDAARLERVFSNLIDNAVKYSPQGGVIIVRVERRDGAPSGVSVKRQEGAPSEWAEVVVRDEGLGIPETDIPRVFERFYRGENVAVQIPGTGLGLAGVRQIIEAHGGTITVNSREGAGSAFTVRLPLRPAE